MAADVHEIISSRHEGRIRVRCAGLELVTSASWRPAAPAPATYHPELVTCRLCRRARARQFTAALGASKERQHA